MTSIEELKQELEGIKARNKRVEKDKAWETSLFRKVVVAVLTYLVIVLLFVFAKLPDPFLNAIVPSFAFVLSTLSLPVFRKIWEQVRKD